VNPHGWCTTLPNMRVKTHQGPFIWRNGHTMLLYPKPKNKNKKNKKNKKQNYIYMLQILILFSCFVQFSIRR
jgi:hypothetical protein